MIFTIKGELVKENKEEEQQQENNNENEPKIILNIDSMSMTNRGSNSEEYKNNKNKIESLINKLMISKIPINSLIINKNDPKLYWKLYLDIFIFDDLRLSLFQLISIGIKNTLLNVKVPKIIIFKNEIDDKFEYDLRKNYEDLTMEDSEEKIKFEVPNIYVFSIINNNLYLDPCDEELIITQNGLYVSEYNKKVFNIESGVETELFRLLRDFELAGAGAVFGFHALGQVGLRAGSDDFAEEFGELGGVFGLFERDALVGFGDLGIAFAVRDAAHGEVHADFGAFAGKVGVETIHDLLVVDFAVADAVNSGERHVGLIGLGDELGGGSLALGAEFGGIVAFVDIAADLANVLHDGVPFFHAPGSA